MITLVAVIVAAALALVLQYCNRRRGCTETYAILDHVFLNVRAPTSEWLNMGWWEDSNVQFSEAAERLATKVLERVPALKPSPRILDVGHGCGDSLLLIHELLRPAVLHGVTSLPKQAKRAQVRTQGKATIFCADATSWLEQSGEQYDVIVAIDCAYHFPDRQRFFKACAAHLKSGGHLVLFDLVGSWPYPPSKNPEEIGEEALDSFLASSLPPATRAPSLLDIFKHRLACLMTSTPFRNLCPLSSYQEQLRHAGFCNSSIADVSHAVFPGFARFLRGLGRGGEQAWRKGSPVQLAGLHTFGQVVEKWAQGGNAGLVRGVIVRATFDDQSQK
ncbi:S-adenosyl-L-methionine-dependent methyltransferase [Tilletiaria anomala UBC 951]|uniref:S-adenosyl-L-methionine-dependent methyltransferase n=1 Tax=Tilletiaria anomala (strain ATCC 24038 / CBS 436.72 / UBC 951) TaxID=1037660 RepID=A0A066VZ58_TILAU|nr:S-adenosyl-L-methionine-dependent methyltransferase [Tilletiaria anomala UBC 951]KDN44104.1 S-adenosyl-L-methionine-dependent methyltransferase [Tilletiaria anomala UBC 951]